MQRINVIGPFRGASGYDRCTREFVREFVRAGIDVELTQLGGWSIDLPPGEREIWFERLSLPVDAQTILHFTMPSWARPKPGKRNMNFTMFEADRIPRSWVDCSSAFECIVLPTQSSFDAWRSSGVPERRLHICPLGVSDFFAQRAAPLAVTDREGKPVVSSRYRFLNIAELRPRKNHLGLLRAWLRATTSDDDAILILKCDDSDALNQFFQDFACIQASLGRSLADAAPVVFLVGSLTDKQIRSLLNTATHYISLSHGEGWDLVMMEAAVAGLDLIAPNHSAYSSYLREDEAVLIPATPVRAVLEGRTRSEDQVFFDGLSWWKPDEDAAVTLIRQIIRGHAPVKDSPRERFLSEYSWANATRRLIEIIQ